MKSEKANTLIKGLLKTVEADYDQAELIEKLKELRELARAEKDPAIVKITRLCYEFIEQNDGFELGFLEEEGIEDMTDLQYLLELMLHSERETNRQEIREIRDMLMAQLY
jgi:hypothetical protein